MTPGNGTNTQPGDTTGRRGVIAWMASNHVTSNILMLVLLIGGFFMATRIKQEVFPEFSMDMVNITVAYPGASPEEVESGIVLVVEEAVRGVSEVKQVNATAAEGMAMIMVELQAGVDLQKAYQDIDQEIARLKLKSMGIEIDTLTEEQKRYLSSCEMGT